MALLFCKFIWLMKKNISMIKSVFVFLCHGVGGWGGGDETHYFNLTTFGKKYQLYAINIQHTTVCSLCKCVN